MALPRSVLHLAVVLIIFPLLLKDVDGGGPEKIKRIRRRVPKQLCNRSLVQMIKNPHETCDEDHTEDTAVATTTPRPETSLSDGDELPEFNLFDLYVKHWVENDDEVTEESLKEFEKRVRREAKPKSTSAPVLSSTKGTAKKVKKSSKTTETKKEENYDQCALNCDGVVTQGEKSKTYAIRVIGFNITRPFLVSCMKDGLMILQRKDGNENFYREWDHYKRGFGSFSGDFFLGLEKLYAITTQRQHKLGIMMEDFNKTIKVATYDVFAIGSEAESYTLKVLGKYSGTAGDGLRKNVGMKFTTKDVKNDVNKKENCATLNRGAWWYKDCGDSNLMGTYESANKEYKEFPRITWDPFTGYTRSLKRVTMVLKPTTEVSHIA